MKHFSGFLAFCGLCFALLFSSLRAEAVQLLIKNGSQSPIQFLLVDSSTGQVGQTGKAGSVVLKISKAGGAGASSAGTVTEVDPTNFPGIYQYTPTAAETSVNGILTLHITCSGCQVVDTSAQVVAFDPNDAALLGLSGVATVSAQATNATAVSAIKTQTDKFLFDGSNYVKSNAQTIQDKTGYALATAPPTLAAIAALFQFDTSGNIKSLVNGYATGQDPATLMLAATVDGTLTMRQKLVLETALMFDAARTYNATTHTAVATYYRRLAGGLLPDLTKPVYIKTTVYDSTDTQPISAGVSINVGNLN